MFSDVNNSEKQAKYEQGEQKCSFQPWFSFVVEFSVSAGSRNYGHDVLGHWLHENNKKVNHLNAA